MTYDELFKLIYIKHKLVKRPDNNELQAIADELLKISRTRNVNDKDLSISINKFVKEKTEMIFNSRDMSVELNIAQQIVDALKKS